jgi:hypothetical protein
LSETELVRTPLHVGIGVIAAAALLLALVASGCGESKEERELACWEERAEVTAEIESIYEMNIEKWRDRYMPQSNLASAELMRWNIVDTLKEQWNYASCANNFGDLRGGPPFEGRLLFTWSHSR